MNTRYRPHLALIAAALATVMCISVGETYYVQDSQGGKAYCEQKSNSLYLTSYTYCTFTCPNGYSTDLKFDGHSVPQVLDISEACGIPPVPTSTPTSPEEASSLLEEPSPTPTATLPGPAPLLTGIVTACNIKDGFINFKLVEAAPSFSGGDMYLEVNGIQVNCTIAGDNRDILSCALPEGVAFPAKIRATIGDASTDDFTYNGDDCVVPHEPKKDGEPPAEPTPEL